MAYLTLAQQAKAYDRMAGANEDDAVGTLRTSVYDIDSQNTKACISFLLRPSKLIYTHI